jgi:hypothetical protein
MTIATLGAINGTWGVVDKETAGGAGAFVSDGVVVCLADSSE